MMRDLRLRRITFLFPEGQPASRAFSEPLASLLSQDPHSNRRLESSPRLESSRSAERVDIAATFPGESLPHIALALAEVNYPQVVFETEQPFQLQAGELSLYSTAVAPAQTAAPANQAPAGPAPGLSTADLYARFDGYISRLDHSGVELPAGKVEPAAWRRLLGELAAVSALYRYPEGQEWPFILPANRAEFQDDIRQFATPRKPKFELTYGYTQVPTLQFHIDTTLPREAVEDRLPDPYGFALPGVETFRSVYLEHPWPGLAVRCDLTFWTGSELSDWDSGEWLVKEGKRIN